MYWDSNPRPLRRQRNALPLSYTSMVHIIPYNGDKKSFFPQFKLFLFFFSLDIFLITY